MEVTGRIIAVLPEQSGVSKNGNSWRKREYVLETQDTYPKKIFFDFFGERADQFPLTIGQEIKLSFDIESREYNGRWYTSIRGWRAEAPLAPAAAAQPAQPSQPFGAPAPAPYPAGYAAPAAAPTPPEIAAPSPTEDLPF